MIYRERRLPYIHAWQSIKGAEIPKDLNISPYQGFQGNGVCSLCHHPISEHLIVEGKFLCPESYIIYEGNKITSVMTKEQFESTYTKVDVQEVENAKN
jgi:hypothetical protein